MLVLCPANRSWDDQLWIGIAERVSFMPVVRAVGEGLWCSGEGAACGAVVVF